MSGKRFQAIGERARARTWVPELLEEEATITISQWEYFMARYGSVPGRWYLRLKRARAHRALHRWNYGPRTLTREFFNRA